VPHVLKVRGRRHVPVRSQAVPSLGPSQLLPMLSVEPRGQCWGKDAGNPDGCTGNDRDLLSRHAGERTRPARPSGSR
jgi:hypothetical protein